MSDVIWLNRVECRSRVGVPAAERRRPQTLFIDVGLEVDARPAADRDDFRLAPDYAAVEKSVRTTAESGSRSLVETLAQTVAAEVLKTQPLVQAVQLRVRKKPVVMPRTQEVVVEIRRERPVGRS